MRLVSALRDITESIGTERTHVKRVWLLLRTAALEITGLRVRLLRWKETSDFIENNVEVRLNELVYEIGKRMRTYMQPSFETMDDGSMSYADKSASIEAYGQRMMMKQSKGWGLPRNRPPGAGGTMSMHGLSSPVGRLMTALKGIRFLMQLVLLWAVQSSWMEVYVARVATTQVDPGDPSPTPPSLTLMLFTFLGLDASLQLGMLVILVLVSFATKRPDNAAILDDAFLQAFLVEYFTSTILLLTLGVLLAALFQRKRYFSLADYGGSGSLAYRDTLAVVCLANLITPYHSIFE